MEIRGTIFQCLLLQYSKLLAFGVHVCSGSDEEASKSIFVDVTFMTIVYCRVKMDPREVTIFAHIEFCKNNSQEENEEWVIGNWTAYEELFISLWISFPFLLDICVANFWYYLEHISRWCMGSGHLYFIALMQGAYDEYDLSVTKSNQIKNYTRWTALKPFSIDLLVL